MLTENRLRGPGSGRVRKRATKAEDRQLPHDSEEPAIPNAAVAVLEQLHRPGPRGVPKYVRLSEALLQAIKSGQLKHGDKLPAEEELARVTPYSLGTVQRALRHLSEQGILIRQHGVGSFVANHLPRLQDPWHCRFIGDDGESVLPIYTKALRRRLVNETGPWIRHLGNSGGRLFRIDRAINVNDEFVVFSRFFADRDLLRRLWDCPLGDLDGENFKALIVRESRLPITEVMRDVQIVPFDREVAKVVGVKAKSLGMLLQAIAHAGRETCVYYQEFYVPPNRRPMRFPAHASDDIRNSL